MNVLCSFKLASAIASADKPKLSLGRSRRVCLHDLGREVALWLIGFLVGCYRYCDHLLKLSVFMGNAEN